MTKNSAATEKNGESLDEKGSTGHPHSPTRLSVHLLHSHPTFVAAALFVLILSGPPRLRIRDAEASLRGEIDWVVFLHVVVWALAGLWVLLQMGKRFCANRRVLQLRLPQILGLALIICLSASFWKSAAPSLTGFKVYQMLVCLLFTQLFVERFGVRTSLRVMLFGDALLCFVIAICASVFPDMVWTPSDFNPEPSRLVGVLIAPAGVVSVLAIILLVTTVRKIWKVLPLSLLALFFALLLLSLMRTAYLVILIFFVLVLLKRPNIKPLRRLAYLLFGLLLMSYGYGRLPSVNRYRSPETISTLSDRIGLWRHLTTVTLKQSPWFGLGYYSASRIYGPEYNPGLGTAHSIFFEALSGGGLSAFAFLTTLCLSLSIYTARLLWAAKDRFSFAISTLFMATLLFGSMGDEIDSGPVAISFWCAAAILPLLYDSRLKIVPRCRTSGNYSSATALGRA